MGVKVFLQSLGCPKNLVDSEMMLGMVARDGGEIVLDPEAADVVIVNTCGFIGAAKRESIDAILDLATVTAGNPSKRLVVTGCLVQRYGAELQRELPEVDAFLGTGDFVRLPEILGPAAGAGWVSDPSAGPLPSFNAAQDKDGPLPTAKSGRLPADWPPPDTSGYGGAAHVLPHIDIPRLRTGQFFSAYLKVSEGCDHTCSFCIIPKIRGRHESRSLASVVAEAEALVADGVVELNLIAQDLTAYGRDRRDGAALSDLLRALARIDGLRWIRLLYNHPRYVSDALLETVGAEDKVCRYIDMPLQHISDRMLRSMRRERDGAAVRRLIDRIRRRLPGVALRTAFIAGFPGETDADFTELLQFVQETRFERVGVFPYSREEGTAAAVLPEQVPEAVKRRRVSALMRAQAAVSAALNRQLIGSEHAVLVCGEDADGRLYGRLATQAPEIDGVVHLRGSAAPGTICPARITGAGTYDLQATIVPSPIDIASESFYIARPLQDQRCEKRS